MPGWPRRHTWRMRLKNPGGLAAAIDNVEYLMEKLADCLKGHQLDAHRAREAWLKWWAEADMDLRDLFAEDDLLAR